MPDAMLIDTPRYPAMVTPVSNVMMMHLLNLFGTHRQLYSIMYCAASIYIHMCKFQLRVTILVSVHLNRCVCIQKKTETKVAKTMISK